MANFTTIDSPQALDALTRRFEQDSVDVPTPLELRLALFASLQETAILTECLGQSVEHTTHLRGGRSIERFLNIDSVIRPWRRAWADLPPAAIKRVTFDIGLPINDQNRGSLGWARQRDSSRQDAFGVDEMVALRLPILLATTMKMRSKDTVKFELVTDGIDNDIQPKEVRRVQGILTRLSPST